MVKTDSAPYWIMRRTGRVIVLCFMFLLGTASGVAAQTTTAFQTGERIRGQVKDCFYEALGQEYSLSVGAYELCPLTARVRLSYQVPAPAATAFKTGERRRGSVKDCYYRALGHDYVSTISAFELCPLSVEVP